MCTNAGFFGNRVQRSAHGTRVFWWQKIVCSESFLFVPALHRSAWPMMQLQSLPGCPSLFAETLYSYMYIYAMHFYSYSIHSFVD